MEDLTQGLIQAPTDDEEFFLHKDGWMDVDIDGNWLDVTKPYKRPKYLLRINGVECFPLGGIQAITGQPGSGKTQVMAMIIAAVLGDTNHNIEYCLVDDLGEPVDVRSVLYIDTEMEEDNTQLVNCRVCAMLGPNWDYHTPHPDKVNYLRLRDEVTAVDRWKKTLAAIYQKRESLTLVLLDGLIDVIADFNDNKECQEVIFKTLALAEHYHIALCMVLHQNPGTDKMVGHAGSFLGRKATDVFVTKKIKDDKTGQITFELKQHKARGKDVPDMLYKVSDETYWFGMPEVISKDPVEMEAPAEIDKEAIMREIITRRDGITTRDLLQAIKQRLSLGTKKATDFIWACENAKIITRDAYKRYHLADPLAQQNEAHF